MDEDFDEFEYDDLEMEAPVCYFNDSAHPVGTYVRSGPDLLRCDKGGVWVRQGSSYEEGT